MRKHSEKSISKTRDKIIGLGDSSIRKNYYPELKNKLKSLEASEFQFRNYIDMSPVGILEVNSKLEIQFANPSFCELSNYDKGKLQNKNLKSLIVSEKPLKLSDIKKTSQENINFEATIIREDGTSFFVILHFRKISRNKILVFVTDITERKVIEKKLEKSEEDYRLLIENQTDLIVKVDKNGNFIFVSKSYCDLFGKTQEELYNRSFTPLVHPDDLKNTLKEMERLYVEPYECYVEQRAQTKKGWRWIAWNDKAVFNNTGEIDYIIGNGRDVTDIKNTEESLKYSEEKFYKAFITSPDSININRLRDGLYIDVNEGFLRTTGYSREEVVGKTSLEMDIWVNGEDRLKLVKGLFSSGSVVGLEAQFRRKDGSIRFGLMSANIIILNNEEHILSITHDITERINARLALERSESIYKAIVHNISDGISLIEDGHVVYQNEKVKEIYGTEQYSAEELRNLAHVSKENKEKVLRFFIEHKNIKVNDVYKLEFELVRKDGERRFVKNLYTGINTSSNSRLVVTQDVTNEVLAERALRESEKLFSTIFHESPEIITISDLETGEYIIVNNAFLQITGYKQEEIIGRTSKELNIFFNYSDREKIARKILNGESIRNEEFVFKTKTGRLLYALAFFTVLEYKNKKCLLSVLNDISQRRLIEDALKESQKKYKYFIEHSTEGIYYIEYQPPIDISLSKEEQSLQINERGFIAECNNAMAKMYGYHSREDLIGKKLYELHGDVNLNKESNLKFIESNYSVANLETIEVSSESNSVYFLNNVIGNIENGYLIGNWGTQRDITELKRTSKSLQASEDKYKSLIENINEVVFSINKNGVLTYISPAITKILNLSPDSLIGSTFDNFVFDEDVSIFREKILEVSEHPHYFSSYEFRLKTSTGSYFWMQSFIKPIYENNRFVGLTGIMVDIHKRKLAELSLEDKVKRLQVIQELYQSYGLNYNISKIVQQFYKIISQYYSQWRFSILLYSEQLNLLVSDSYWGISSEIKFPTGTQETDFSISGKCFSEKRIVNINNCNSSEIIPKDIVEYLHLKSCVALPIQTRERVLGVLRVDDTVKNEAFSKIEIDFFMMLADQLALVIENAKLFLNRKESEEKISASLKEKEILLKEVHHRVKNNLQIISSLLNLQSISLKDASLIDVFKDSQNRVRTMALIHEKLYQSNSFAKIDFGSYIKSLADYLFRSYNINPTIVKLEVEIINIYLPTDSAIACGLILNEFISNSLKYAFPEGRTGSIKITMQETILKNIILTYLDDGVGIPVDINITNTKSLGLKLVSLLTNQLNGKITLDRTNGTLFVIEFKG